MSTLSERIAQHELQQSEHHARPRRPARSARNDNGPSARVLYHHHPDPSGRPCPANAIPSAGWRKHARIRQARGEPVPKVHPKPTRPRARYSPLTLTPASVLARTGSRRCSSRTVAAGPSIWLPAPTTRGFRPAPCGCPCWDRRPLASSEDSTCARGIHPASCP